MSYSFGREQRKYKQDWKKRLPEEYAAAGMSEEAIAEMEKFDRQWLNSERKFYRHIQSMDYRKVGGMHEENTSKSYLRKFGDKLRVEEQITDPARRYAWVDEMDNEELVKSLSTLSEKEMELITLIVFKERPQKEIAQIWGVSEAAITRMKGRIRKKLKKF